MMSKYNQLILFDCDGGRSSLFNDKTILYDLPSNCECYLFWNKDSKTLIDILFQLRDISQIHLCPSHLKNSKNSADGKLIYFWANLSNVSTLFSSFILMITFITKLSRLLGTIIIHKKLIKKKIRTPTN